MPHHHWEKQGYGITPADLPPSLLHLLREEAFPSTVPGTRCLLHLPSVAQAASLLHKQFQQQGLFSLTTRAIQAIAFDKSPQANWNVAWHQDLMFPLAKPATTPGYDLPCLKHGINYARPPRPILEQLWALRLHLDDCDATNGPLRVIPSSHLQGIIPNENIPPSIANQQPIECHAREGDVMLMRPLLLHASSKALLPKHRRIIHIVYHHGPTPPEPWHS